MSVIQTKKHVHKLYDKIFNITTKEFLKVVNAIAAEIYDEALALGFDGDIEDLDEAWVEEFFDEYNPVTKYVFSNEIGRKESRLFEALISSRKEKFSIYTTAGNLLKRQIKQYAIELEDSVTREVFKAVGVEKVKWSAEIDHKTCGVCQELDGAVFKLNEAPPKQHYNCRCYLIPVK